MCHLRGLDAAALVAAGEEPTDAGGYFIVNGHEKVLRLLIMPRYDAFAGVRWFVVLRDDAHADAVSGVTT